MTRDIARQVRARFNAVNTRPMAAGTRGPMWLSENALRVLQWVGEGYLTQEIARGLSVTSHEVGLLIRSLYRRLHANMRSRQPVPGSP